MLPNIVPFESARLGELTPFGTVVRCHITRDHDFACHVQLVIKSNTEQSEKMMQWASMLNSSSNGSWKIEELHSTYDTLEGMVTNELVARGPWPERVFRQGRPEGT